MKQLITLILAVLLSAGAFAQENNDQQQSVVILEKKMHDVQLNLRQAYRNRNASLIIGIIGAGVMAVPAFSNSGKNNSGYYMLGGACLTLSFVVGQAAWSNIGQAGKVGWERPQKQYYYYDEPVPDDGWEPESGGDLSEEIGPTH